ncbi:MAG: CopG family transcriptional regulator [Ardenticatenaceae bacterium]|nr:CopG family transcriptional regulator [Ardenticatenaceae bacterium]
MKKSKKTEVQAAIPDELLIQAQNLVTAGWFHNLEDVMVAALRSFLESHKGELMEEFIHQDVGWGLHGDE